MTKRRHRYPAIRSVVDASVSRSTTRNGSRDLIALFLISLAFRIGLLLLYPVPYGNDGIGRLYFSDSLFLGHWLPLTQTVVFGVTQLTSRTFVVRVVFAAIGALAAGGFCLFLRLLTSRGAAFFGGLLFSLNALYVILSLMPYQDVLFLGLFYTGLAFLAGKEPILKSASGSLFYGLACLTRYEGWFLLPFLVIWKAKRHRSRPVAALLKAGLYFGWAPALWLAISLLNWGSWQGFLHQTPTREFYAWNPHLDLRWTLSYTKRMLFWIGLFGTPLVLFSLPGLVATLRRRAADPAIKLLLLFGVLVLVFFFFVIGKGFETVNRFVMIPLSIVLVFTVLGLGETFELLRRRAAANWFFGPRAQHVLAAGAVVALMVYAAIPVARLNARPEFKDPYKIAIFLDRTLSRGETALVVAERFPDLSDAAPMAYQRIVVQSKHNRDRILCSGLLDLTSRPALLDYAIRNNVRYLAVFGGFRPFLKADIYFADYPHTWAETVEPVLRVSSATVYRVMSWQSETRGLHESSNPVETANNRE